MNTQFVAASMFVGLGLPLLAQQPATSPAEGKTVPAAQPAATPAAQPTPAAVTQAAGTTQPVTATPIVVKAVKGKVTYRTLPDGERKPAKPGDLLSEGMEVSTGINSAIELQIGAGQVFTIDRVSRVILREAIATQGKEKTTVAVPYGRVQFEVSSATVANDVQIQAPDATLAVKGTTGGIEVTPGFATLAFGGDLNKGVFDVSFEQEIVSTFRGNEKANNSLPATAKYALEGQFVDINDIWSHDGDEEITIRDFQTILFLLLEIVLREAVPEAPFDVFFLDEATLDLYRADVFGTGGLIGSTSGAVAGQGNGLAVDFQNGEALLYRLEDNDGTPELLVLDLNSGSLNFTNLGDISADGDLEGLGAIGSELYTIINPRAASQIGRIELDSKGLFADPVMDLGIPLEGDLAGVTVTGELYVAGRLPTISGFSNGSAGILGPNGVLLAVDPRANYLTGAASDINADLSVRPETIVEAGITINSIQQVTGVSVVVTAFGDPLLLVTTRATVNNVPNVTLFNLFTLDANGNTVLSQVGRAAFMINALGAESRGAPPAIPTLAAAPSPSQIDLTAGALFADLAYSQASVDSGVLARLIANQIVQTADDPSACAASSELATQLSGAINAHIDQRSGAGAAIFDFRAGLSPGHPCLPPGPTPGSLAATTSMLYYDTLTGDLHARTLTGIDEVIAQGEGELKPVLGAATTPLQDGGRTLFTLFNRRDENGLEIPVLRSRNIDATGSVGAESDSEVIARREIPGGFRSFELGGLAAIGSNLYTSGRTIDELDDGSSGGTFNTFVSETTIYQMGVVQGTPTERMVLPMDLQLGALAGAPSRGSIFALGSLRDSAGHPTAFNLAGTLSNAVLLELDPRTNYLVSAQSFADGSFRVQSGTSVSGGVNLTDLSRVTGMAYLGDTLVMTAIDSQGNQVFVQYLPNATNAPSDPRLRRLNGQPAGVTRFGELAAESIGPVPASQTLSPPTSPIDTFSINQTFANMAYSQQAVNSGVLAAMVRDHVAATAANPAGCRASAELQGPSIPGFLGQHVNQQAGVGQTVFQFRNGLPPNHPCRPPGGPG